jgi:glycosyltransferase involved in cell wall biosynthesis
VRTLVVRRTAERDLVGRTLRALDAAGVPAQDAATDLASALAGVDEPIWLVRAGAWPVHPGPIPSPPPSATGRPLVAFGSLSAARRVDPSDRPASLYLEVDPARELVQRLTEGCDFDEAARGLLAGDRWRVVRFAPLDVRDDPGLRVIQVVTSLQRGGAERLTLDLAAELGRRGAACLLVTLGRPTRQAFATPKGAVELAPLALDREARAMALGRLARAFGADVVHGHLLDAHYASLIAAQRVPLVLTIHNQRPGWPDGLSTLGAGGAALLVACARAVESDLIAAGLPVPVRVVWNGIDPAALASTPARRLAGREFRRRLKLDPRDFVLLVLANPRPQKRLDRLPDVLAATRAELARRAVRREARLVIAGAASPTNATAIQSVEAVRARIDRLGLAKHVRWAGSVTDVAMALAAADVLVSTSDYEGLSLAQLEALAAGVPVVATDAGGVGELAPGDPAVAILPRDVEPEQFAEVLAERAVNPIPTMLPVHFTAGTMAARYSWLYSRAIAAARPRRQGDGLFLITNNFSLGGAQTSARRLLAGMAAVNIRPRAAVLDEEPDHATPGRRALLAAGIPVLGLAPARSIDAAEHVAQLLAHLDDDPPVAVLLWNVIPEYRVLIADGLIDVPLFDVSPGAMSFDALDRYFERPRPGLPYRHAADYGARLAGAIVKYQAEVARASNMLRCPVHLIANGVPIDTNARRPASRRLVIGTAARVNPQKRLDLLLDAIHRAHPSLPPYVLRVAGGVERGCDDHAALLRRRAEGLPVDWLGGLDDVTEFLRDLDIFVLVAEPAGCPNASLEAMAAGLPVVATDVGGMAEQIEDGVTGRLVGRDSPDEFAAAVVEAASDRNLRAAWGEAGKKRVAERFGLERMIADYRRVCLDGDESGVNGSAPARSIPSPRPT